jgi:hypothetical protein
VYVVEPVDQPCRDHRLHVGSGARRQHKLRPAAEIAFSPRLETNQGLRVPLCVVFRVLLQFPVVVCSCGV